MQINLKSLCAAGPVLFLAFCLILLDCPSTLGSPHRSVRPHHGASALDTVSGNPNATREEWLSAINGLVEKYRKKGPQSRAPRDLLQAGEAYLTTYRKWRHREDLDTCIRLMGEFTRVERRGPEFIAGLTILKEAHLLKRKIDKTSLASACPPVPHRRVVTAPAQRPVTPQLRPGDSTLPRSPASGPASISPHRGPISVPTTANQGPGNRPPAPPVGPGSQQASAGRDAQVKPEQTDEASAYKYTGNPFCGEERNQTTLPLGYLLPRRPSYPEDRQPVPPQPSPQPKVVETVRQPPPSPPAPPAPVMPEVKSASLPPSTVSDASPPVVLAPRLAREFLIVLDPGHGGKDPGAVSADGSVKEKDIALEVAKRVKQRLASCNSTVRVELTRSDDRFLALEERTALANAANADLFISIHCNADTDASSKGVETFYLSKATSRRAMRVAARENGISLGKMTDVEATLLDLLLTSKKCESDNLASIVHGSLLTAMRPLIPALKDRGVKPAPFYVLLGAQMPAILVECAFISNARDRLQLTSPAFLDSVATGIAEGAVTYLGGLEAQK